MIAREYVDVVIHFDKEGNALPVFIYLDGKRYKCKKFGPITREPKVGKGVWKYIVTTPLGLISLYREKDRWFIDKQFKISTLGPEAHDI